jgi:hypothetical protein
LPRPPIDLHLMVREILQHSSPLLPQSDCPIRHFERSANTGVALLKYIDDHVEPDDVYAAVYDRHLGHLRRMVLAELIEAFERFLKELAAACIDFLAQYTTDDRYDDFVPKRSDKIAAFVNAPSIGKALCESDTWLSNGSINARFASLLKEPSGAAWELLFRPARQPPAAEQDRAATLAVLWQIRHTLAHNVGVITHSDSIKLRMLTGAPVRADRWLSPSVSDLRYTKRFLSEAAANTNARVCQRIVQLLESFHSRDRALFDAQAKANDVSQRFDLSVTISGCASAP